MRRQSIPVHKRRRALTLALLGALGLAGLTGLAAADRPIEVPVFVEFDDVDPCTGEPMTVTFTGTSRIHAHGDRVVIVTHRTISTTTGFEGRGTDVLVDNGQVFKVTVNDMLKRGPGGDNMRVHVVFVLDLSTFAVRTDQFSITCLGP